MLFRSNFVNLHTPSAMERGTQIHKVFEEFVSNTAKSPDLVTHKTLIETAHRVLAENVPWPTDRIQWRVRIEKIAKWFVAQEQARRIEARPVLFEKTGRMELHKPPFRITAKADRIDIDTLGQALIYDYKTGTAPSENRQLFLDVQLLVTAAIVCEGGFEQISPRGVAEAVYIALGGDGKEVRAPLEKRPPDQTVAMLVKLIEGYRDPDMGFTARNKMHKDAFGSDYDQLSRFGEWDASDAAQKVFLS